MFQYCGGGEERLTKERNRWICAEIRGEPIVIWLPLLSLDGATGEGKFTSLYTVAAGRSDRGGDV